MYKKSSFFFSYIKIIIFKNNFLFFYSMNILDRLTPVTDVSERRVLWVLGRDATRAPRRFMDKNNYDVDLAAMDGVSQEDVPDYSQALTFLDNNSYGVAFVADSRVVSGSSVPLDPDFSSLLQRLNDNRIPTVVVSAYSSGVLDDSGVSYDHFLVNPVSLARYKSILAELSPNRLYTPVDVQGQPTLDPVSLQERVYVGGLDRDVQDALFAMSDSSYRAFHDELQLAVAWYEALHNQAGARRASLDVDYTAPQEAFWQGLDGEAGCRAVITSALYAASRQESRRRFPDECGSMSDDHAYWLVLSDGDELRRIKTEMRSSQGAGDDINSCLMVVRGIVPHFAAQGHFVTSGPTVQRFREVYMS
jgi:hypothetical protein